MPPDGFLVQRYIVLKPVGHNQLLTYNEIDLKKILQTFYTQ